VSTGGKTSGGCGRRWENFHNRFNLAGEPNEPFRFGWVIEIDPYDPNFVPKKRTALGHTKHEGATVVVARDRRVVVYSGDDERFDYLYKFVSNGRFNRADRGPQDRAWLADHRQVILHLSVRPAKESVLNRYPQDSQRKG
jgi:Predicted phosphatase